MAAVSVVLPWSMCPMVPMLRWGLVRSNFFLAMVYLGSVSCPWRLVGAASHRQVLLTAHPGDDLARDRLGDLLVGVELHRVGRPPLCARAQIRSVAEHLG